MDAGGPVDITSTFGAAFVGCLGMMVLYGLTSVQTYIYFTFYPEDSVRLKSLVWLIWILDTLHISLVCHALYHYLVTNYATPAALVWGIWSLWLSIIINTAIGCIVQTFFTVKLHALLSPRTRVWMIPIILIFVACHLAFGIETAAWGLVLGEIDRLSTKTWVSALPFAAFAVLSDMTIATCLCVALNKNKSYFMTTNNLINHLMIFAINRCLLTAGVAIIEVIIFVSFPNALWYLAVDFLIGKLYANSLLATLNTRYSIRARWQGQTSRRTNDFDTAPTFRFASSGAEHQGGVVFSTVVQMGASIADEESTGEHTSVEDGDKISPKSRPLSPEEYELEAR